MRRFYRLFRRFLHRRRFWRSHLHHSNRNGRPGEGRPRIKNLRLRSHRGLWDQPLNGRRRIVEITFGRVVQIRFMHAPDCSRADWICALLVPPNAVINGRIGEALDLESVAVLRGKGPISELMRRVEVSVVYDDLQASLQRFNNKFCLSANDLAFAFTALLAELLSNLVFVCSNGPHLSAPVQSGELPVCPCGLAGSRKTSQKEDCLHVREFYRIEGRFARILCG